MQMIDGLI